MAHRIYGQTLVTPQGRQMRFVALHSQHSTQWQLAQDVLAAVLYWLAVIYRLNFKSSTGNEPSGLYLPRCIRFMVSLQPESESCDISLHNVHFCPVKRRTLTPSLPVSMNSADWWLRDINDTDGVLYHPMAPYHTQSTGLHMRCNRRCITVSCTQCMPSCPFMDFKWDAPKRNGSYVRASPHKRYGTLRWPHETPDMPSLRPIDWKAIADGTKVIFSGGILDIPESLTIDPMTAGRVVLGIKDTVAIGEVPPYRLLPGEIPRKVVYRTETDSHSGTPLQPTADELASLIKEFSSISEASVRSEIYATLLTVQPSTLTFSPRGTVEICYERMSREAYQAIRWTTYRHFMTRNVTALEQNRYELRDYVTPSEPRTDELQPLPPT